MASHADAGDPVERAMTKAAPTGGMTVFGRQGSPTVTFALPFSRVEVKADDAAPLVAELAALTARLARALATSGLSDATAAELTAIANAAEALASVEPQPR